MPAARGIAAIAFVVLCACTAPSGPSADASGADVTVAERATEAAAAEPVTFDSSGLTVAGDLRRPDGPGPYPGVVLIHGSGPSDRDGVVPGQLAMTFPRPVAVLADLAMALREAGYAVLTYDKRTCGPFNGCADNGYPEPSADLTIEAFVADATAAVEYLRSRRQVRPEAIAVAGHSQGASFVPGMLLDDPRLAAGVMLSAPFDSVDALLAGQAEVMASIVADLDPAPAGAAQGVTQLRRLARSVTALRTGDVDDATTIGGATAGFWRSWLRVADGVPQLAQQAEQPLLVLNGAADTNVGPDQTARWRRTLTGDGDRVVELDCVSHALNCLHTNEPAAVDPGAIDATVDPRVPETVVQFLDEAMRDERQPGAGNT